MKIAVGSENPNELPRSRAARYLTVIQGLQTMQVGLCVFGSKFYLGS